MQIANIDQLSLDAFALLDFAADEIGDVLAGAAFSHRTENHRNEEWSSVHGRRVRRLFVAGLFFDQRHHMPIGIAGEQALAEPESPIANCHHAW